MTYQQFKSAIINYPLIPYQTLRMMDNSQGFRNQVSRWEHKGYLIKLRKGLYILNETERKITPSRFVIAHHMYTPSYISGESALAFYDMIPERVYELTSITTRKTVLFENAFGVFRYRHLDISRFSGFVEHRDENGLPFFLAEPEKALVDFIYLNLSSFHYGDRDVFENSYRFQNLERLRIRRLVRYAALFKSRKLDAIISMLQVYVKELKV